MVNMRMSAEEAKEWAQPTAADAPEYPYGLCIDLNDDALQKLGITTLPAVGAVMTLQAQVVVTRTGATQTQGNEAEASLGLQITDMELSGPTRSHADRLYGD